MPMAPEYSQRYGVPIVTEDLDDGLLRITGLVEKPKPQDAPSSYAAIGGYVVTPGVVDELREQTKRWYDHKTGEVYLGDAINAYAKGRAPSTGRSFRATAWCYPLRMLVVQAMRMDWAERIG